METRLTNKYEKEDDHISRFNTAVKIMKFKKSRGSQKLADEKQRYSRGSQPKTPIITPSNECVSHW